MNHMDTKSTVQAEGEQTLKNTFDALLHIKVLYITVYIVIQIILINDTFVFSENVSRVSRWKTSDISCGPVIKTIE